MGVPKNTPLADHPAAAVAAFLAGLAPAGRRDARLCVALSGGRDSVVLLHLLWRLAQAPASSFTLSALHVHHGLSAHADRWAQFCADLCRSLAVPLRIVKVDVPRDSGEGIEAAARRLRHAAFADCRADWLALAHHRDDQAETILLNLLRGAGVAGAAGMLAVRPQGGVGAFGPTLIRPLLAVAQTAIAAYAEAQQLVWVNDESNGDTSFRRNFLRHDILPPLETRFPGARQALARAAGHFAEASDLLDDLALLDRQACLAPSGRIRLACFNALPLRRARNLLRHELLSAGFRAPQARWLDEALRQLGLVNAAAETCVSTPDGDVQVYRGEIHAVRDKSVAPDSPDSPDSPDPLGTPVPWRGECELPWAGGRIHCVAAHGAGLSQRLLQDNLLLFKARQGGERLQMASNRPRRHLRNLLQEGAIPPWERPRLPCLWCGERLVWVGGVGADTAFACAADEAGWVLRWEA